MRNQRNMDNAVASAETKHSPSFLPENDIHCSLNARMLAYQGESPHHLVIKQARVENHSALSVLTPVHESQTASLQESECRILLRTGSKW